LRKKPTVKLYLLTPESGAEASEVRILFCGRKRRKKELFKKKKRRRKEEKKKGRRGMRRRKEGVKE